MPESDNYQSPNNGISYFHPLHNMSPYRAASLLRKAAKMHAPSAGAGKGKAKRGMKAAPKHAMMPMRQSGGARVFGGKK